MPLHQKKTVAESEVTVATNAETVAESSSASTDTQSVTTLSIASNSSTAQVAALTSSIVAKKVTASASLATLAAPKKDVPLVEVEISGTKLNIQYNGTKATDEKIAFAVWSNDQDDLHWYDADAKGATYVELSRYKSYGLYFVHPYAFSAKVPRGLNGMTVTLPKPKIETTIKQVNQTQFEVLVRKVPATITSITVPVWSDKNGQDDLIPGDGQPSP